MQEKKLTFRFSGKMARLLGRESVSGDVAALFELVKNAYDADATKVLISFENFSSMSKDSPQITIQDNGDGMTMNEIDKNWMVIGTYSKDKVQRSRRGRRVVGNKGIGRFSTEKLAKNIILISRPRTGPEEITMRINWDDYEKEDVTFEEVGNLVQIKSKRDDPRQHGTTIILKNLRDTWTEEKLKKLKMSIASIVLPSELAKATGDPFEVEMDAPDFASGIERKIHSLLFKHAPFKLTAILSEQGDSFTAHLSKESKEILTKRIELKDEILESGGKWVHFGKCRFSLYFYPGDSKKEKWEKYYRMVLKISKITDYLRDIHGVKIYRDNFWVRPYGEKGNDWLNLDKERVMSNLKVGNTQVVGFVEITKDGNPMIMDTTTRERLVENSEFESLKMFVKKSVDVLNNYRIEESRLRKEESVKKEYQAAIEEEVNYLKEMVDDAEGLPDPERKAIKQSLKNITKLFDEFKDESEQDYGEIEREKRTYRNLATLGISSATTSHEINNIMAVIAEIPKSILGKLKQKPIDSKGIEDDVKEAYEYFKTIKQFMKFIRHFVLSVKEDFESKQEKEKVNVKEVLENLLKSFDGLLSSKNIQPVDLRVRPDDLVIYINRADLYSIMVNLLTNSIKALNTLSNAEKKKIRITVEKGAYDLKFVFSNNGPEIPDKYRQSIFDMFFSRYEEGTGLGLTIVNEIVEEYGGKIEVKDKTEFEPGATFEIKIPLEELKK